MNSNLEEIDLRMFRNQMRRKAAQVVGLTNLELKKCVKHTFVLMLKGSLVHCFRWYLVWYLD